MRWVFCCCSVLLCLGCLTVNVSLFGERGPLEERTIQNSGADKKVVVVSVNGVLHEQQQGLFVTEDTPAYLAEQLRKAASDEDVVGVILRVSSPGGSVTASDLMYQELMRFRRRTKRPVVAWISGLGASGAYYLCCGADAIVAHPTAVVGSIGVIALLPNLEGLMQKVGVSVTVLKCGDFKDSGNPFRKMTDAEKRYFQHLLDGAYRRFKAVVAEGRGLPSETVGKVADGRVFTAQEAKKLSLVDEVGNFETALKHILRLAKVKEANVVVYERPGTYRPTEYSAFMRIKNMLSPGFYYLWPVYIGSQR